jgi:hypothetical protein
MCPKYEDMINFQNKWFLGFTQLVSKSKRVETREVQDYKKEKLLGWGTNELSLVQF